MYFNFLQKKCIVIVCIYIALFLLFFLINYCKGKVLYWRVGDRMEGSFYEVSKEEIQYFFKGS